LLVGFGALGLTAFRHGPIFAIIALPITARLLSRRPSMECRTAWSMANRRDRLIEGSLLGVVVIAVAIAARPASTVSGNDRADADWFGSRALPAVASGQYPQPIWNSYDQGTYLIWHGWPEVLVSMDSRTDLYGDDLVREHIAEWHGERDAPQRFADQGIRSVIDQLERAGWQRVDEDARAVVLLAPDRTRAR
jgi:hypothetical protein